MNALPLIRECSALVALGQSGQFSRAARRIGVSAPTFSRLISRLEDVLGARLVDRSSVPVRLTEVGQVLFDELDGLDTKVQGAAEKAILARDGLIGEVRIGYSSIAMNCTLPGFLKELGNRLPDIEILLRLQTSEHQIASLKAGQLDLAFCSLEREDDELMSTPLTRHPIELVMREDDPLASLQLIAAEQLVGRPLILGNKDRWPSFNPLVDSFIRQKGLTGNPVRRAEDFESLCALVAVGMGLGFFTGLADEMKRSGLTTRRVEGLDAVLVESLFWRPKSSNMASRRVFDFALDYFGADPTGAAAEIPR